MVNNTKIKCAAASIPSEVEKLMPESVVLLKEEDVMKYGFGQKEKHCLVGWCRDQFGFDIYDERAQPYDFARDRLSEFCKAENDNAYPVGFNDHPDTTHKQIARFWNKFVKWLGYTETFYE